MREIAVFEANEVYRQGIVSVLSKEGFTLNSLDKVVSCHLKYDLFIIGFSEEQIETCFQICYQRSSPLLAIVDEKCRSFMNEIVFKAKPFSFFHRASPVSILLRAVHLTIRSQRFVDQKVAPWLLDVYKRGPETKLLSDRELSILKLVIVGNSNKEIARKLYISLPTVKFHLKNIYQKTKTANRKELMALYSNLFIE